MKKTMIGSAILLSVGLAVAQDAFVVATGDYKAGSTYSTVFKELAKACNYAQLNIVEKETTGSIQNVDLLTSNTVNAAIVQSDMLFYTKLVDETKVANIKALFTLYPEELHFIARSDVKKEGGFAGFGGKNVTFNTLSDLAGRNVGAVGGSIISGKIVSAQSKLGFKIVEFPNNEVLKAALLNGDVDTILVVGGAPHALVKSLSTQFKLLSVSPEMQKTLATVYTPAKLSYTNLNQAGVQTIATQSEVVTRTYRSKDMVNTLVKLRLCFTEKLGDIQDTRGTHAKWQLVNPEDKGKWEWYSLPGDK